MASSSSSASAAANALADALGASAARALDALYSRVTALNGKFFHGGWGDLDLVRIDAAREAAALVSRRVALGTVAAAQRGEEQAAGGWRPDWKTVERSRGRYVVYEARFESPAADASLPALGGSLLPRESRFARARLILPDGPGAGGGGSSDVSFGGVASEGGGLVVHLPATGDHDWARRTRLALPLAMGLPPPAPLSSSSSSFSRQQQQHQQQQAAPSPPIGALLLEGPFYGARRPEGQVGSKIRSVADLFVLGWATIAEALLLAGWARGESARQGVCGLSMGGVHAAMSAALSPHALAAAPLLAPRSAVAPYVDGALSLSVDVGALVGRKGPSFSAASIGRDASAAAAAEAAAEAADAAATAAEAAALSVAGPTLRRVAAAVRAASQGSGGGDDDDDEDEDEEDESGGGRPRRPLRMPRAARAIAALDALEAALVGMEAEAEAAGVAGIAAAASAAQGPRRASSSSSPAILAAAVAAASAAAAVPAAVASAASGLRAAAAARLSLFRWQQQQHTPRGADAAASSSSTPPTPLLVGGGGWPWGGGGGSNSNSSNSNSSNSSGNSSNSPENALAWAALRAALEAYTDVTRFPVPRRPDAAVLVAARDDAYAPPADARLLQRHWPGSEMRIVPGGHVSAFLLEQDAFRRAVADSVARL